MLKTNQKSEAKENHILAAKEVIAVEMDAITALEQRLDDAFNQACELVRQTPGHVIVTGMGKSGHIAHKIAATLASTGTPAFYVHPGEANHGDLGMVTNKNLVIALSNSGKTDEILSLLPILKRLATPVIAITGDKNSPLAQHATVHLDASVAKEACPLGLAPTASTTVALVLGDALAIALLKARGFTKEEFAQSHPGGTLGKRLLVTIQDIMRTGKDIPIVNNTASIAETIMEITAKSLGISAVVNEQQQLVGVFTDGDLRRTLALSHDFKTTPIEVVMSKNPTTLSPNVLAANAVSLMEKHKINSFLVTDEQQHVVGAFNLHDLLQAKVI